MAWCRQSYNIYVGAFLFIYLFIFKGEAARLLFFRCLPAFMHCFESHPPVLLKKSPDCIFMPRFHLGYEKKKITNAKQRARRVAVDNKGDIKRENSVASFLKRCLKGRPDVRLALTGKK